MALILTVSELTRTVRDVLEGHIGEVWVEGEISNYRKQSSGHHYFTLKDDRSQVACVMFARSYGAQSRVPLSDGMQIQAYGRVTVYEARGQYQLIVELVQTRGRGVLQARFEALKRKLEAEGIAETIRYLNLKRERLRLDVLIVGRGGGSLEDLWQFNEEAVARAIYDS